MTQDPLFTLIDHYVQAGVFPPDLGRIASAFCRDYQKAIAESHIPPAKVREGLTHLIELAARQIQDPYPFACIHHKIRSPFDYTQFGLDLIGPLLDREHSSVSGEDNITRIESQLAQGDSCIFLANHQIEADPQVMHLLLAKRHPKLTDIYYVAGDRVTTDPLAVPLSLGTNMVCIFSKKHMEHPPEQKEAKLQHNRHAMQQLSELLTAGGCCVWVAPSGGRDRANAEGTVEVAPFDPQSVEMFHLLAKKTARPVHFYPLAIATYPLLPPPQLVQQAIGEPRKIRRTAAHLAFGEELDLALLGTTDLDTGIDKKEQRRLRADAVWNIVQKLYLIATRKPTTRLPPC